MLGQIDPDHANFSHGRLLCCGLSTPPLWHIDAVEGRPPHRLPIDNNATERAIRPIAIGRKNFLFAVADAGGEILADAMTVIETAKLSGLDPEAHLADILTRIRDHDPAKLDDLLPWNWSAQQPATAEAA